MGDIMISLNGTWRLCGRKESGEMPRIFKDGDFTIKASVPGNIELDLFNANIIKDPYVKLNALDLRPFEFYEWCYTGEFELDHDVHPKTELVFDGLDCLGTVWLNGSCVGSSENALVQQRFTVGTLLKKGKNEIAVHLASANNAFRKYPLLANTLTFYAFNYEAIRIRKPAHVWGWDITPRMAIGGIFRDVYLDEKSPCFISDHILQLEQMVGANAQMLYSFKIESDDYSIDDLEITLDGKCGDSEWHTERAVWSAQSVWRFVIEKPLLWWPRRYGNPDIYTVTAVLRRKSTKEVLDTKVFNYGIRTIKLHKKPVCTNGSDPEFYFTVNGKLIKILGCNHVPADALHSKDRERLPQIIEMACDMNCNMLRVWGGGVYEDELFYDLCDRSGIMVWQDFMLGCARYPYDDEFKNIIRDEAVSAVRRLRHHPSIALWSGDNECDYVSFMNDSLNPNDNVLSRQVLPQVCRIHDPARAYLESSPWVSQEAFDKAVELGVRPWQFTSEQHLWGPRDYFKSDYYRNTQASFVSEIGYHGCPNVSSIKKFISSEKVWPYTDNIEWDYHASNPYVQDNDVLSYRTHLMANQIKEMFGFIPDNLEDFALASQICQAEAKKFFVEIARSKKKLTGLLWWNLIDCWPQFSDAIVDYYFGKKLAYYYLRRIQSEVVVQVKDPNSWHQEVIVSNFSNKVKSGSYKVYDADTDELFASGDFTVGSNEIISLAMNKICTTVKRMLLIEWTLADGTKGVNHALCGNPQFEFSDYRRWLKKIAELDNSFDAEKIAK